MKKEKIYIDIYIIYNKKHFSIDISNVIKLRFENI